VPACCRRHLWRKFPPQLARSPMRGIASCACARVQGCALLPAAIPRSRHLWHHVHAMLCCAMRMSSPAFLLLPLSSTSFFTTPMRKHHRPCYKTTRPLLPPSFPASARVPARCRQTRSVRPHARVGEAWCQEHWGGCATCLNAMCPLIFFFVVVAQCQEDWGDCAICLFILFYFYLSYFFFCRSGTVPRGLGRLCYLP
jgi:hypothetical protein